MWLLTAVNNVNGQTHFTFPLEQKKVYTLGRGATSDIRFGEKRVRIKEGTIEVGDWDPTNPKVPPRLSYKPSAKANGSIGTYAVVTTSPDNAGSIDLEEYARDAQQQSGVWLDNLEQPGQGVRFDAAEPANENYGWFLVRWVNLCIQYDHMKDQDEDTLALLNRYCIAYTLTFDTSSPPTVALSPTFRAANDLSYAVCYGIPICTPEYLTLLLDKIAASWKKITDSEDSFTLPDTSSQHLQPTLDAKLPLSRKTIECWLPDPSRRELFQGWKILGLRNKGLPVEKRWITSMGADWAEIDIVSQPLLSAKDFKDRMTKWIADVDETVGRKQAVVTHFHGVKEAVSNAGVDWNRVVVNTCVELGVWLVSGSMCWGSVKYGGLDKYLEATAPQPPAPTSREASLPPAEAAASRRSPRKAQSRLPPPRSPSPLMPDPTPALVPSQPLQVPSTHPEELTPEPDQPTSTAAPPATARRPLKRRAGKTTVDLFSMDEPVPMKDASPAESLEKIEGGDSLTMPPSAQREAEATQLSQPSQPPATAASAQPKISRLKRRAGGTQASAFDVLATAETPAHSIKEEETPAEIRALYEETRRPTRGGAGSGTRSRVVSNESRGDVDMDESSTSNSTLEPASLPRQGRDGDGDIAVEGVDMEEEEDFVQKTLRKALTARKAGAGKTGSRQTDMPPPALPLTRRRSPSPIEETEQVESKRPRLASPQKKTKSSGKGKAAQDDVDMQAEPSNTPTQDEAFLQAISKNKSKKKEMDALDKEFNNLRIPKPKGAGAAGGKDVKGMEGGTNGNGVGKGYEGPDYSVLNDFNDEMRGNFIQVVRVNLFRTDGGRKVAEVADDGRPNFKKFKKKTVVRREPVSLVLVGQNTEEAEMGEPYWLDPTSTGSRRTQNSQASQMHALDGGDEDTLPILPRQRKMQTLLEDDEDDDGLEPLPLTNTGRRRGGDTQAGRTQTQTQAQAQTLAPPRRTRATSVMSEESTVSASTATRSRRGAASKSTTSTSAAALPAAAQVSATGAGAASTARSRVAASKKASSTKKAPILLDDSDDDDLKFTASNVGKRGSAGTGGRGKTAGSSTTTQSKLFTTDAGDIGSTALPASTSASGMGTLKRGVRGLGTGTGTGTVGTQSVSAGGGGTRSRGAGAMGGGTGRRMLVDDDDEDDDAPVLTTAAKKRRLG